MVRRRRRRRARRAGRRSRLSRRLFRMSRRRWGRRRMLRRRYRRSKGIVVSMSEDCIVDQSSALPIATLVKGGYVGVRSSGFHTWCINPLPPNLRDVVGHSNMTGGWSSVSTDIPNRLIGVGSQATNETKMLTDLPLTVSNISLYQWFNCKTMWDIATSYRIKYISITLTVPENTNGEKNHNLYIEWTNLPKVRSAAFEDCRGMVMLENPNSAFDPAGWNWIGNPPDIAEACSIYGHDNRLNGWHRKQLNYVNPVTIRFRPRHTKISFSHTNYIDYTASGSVTYRANPEWANGDKLVRSFLPCDVADVNTEKHYWMGPVIRLIDADMPRAIGVAANANIFERYGIKATVSAKLALRGIKANDPIFPEYVP